MDTSFHLYSLKPSLSSSIIFFPSNKMLPSTTPGGLINLRSERAVVLLPHPDSPAKPKAHTVDHPKQPRGRGEGHPEVCNLHKHVFKPPPRGSSLKHRPRRGPQALWPRP